jgi:hypothetical protein
MSGGRAIDLTGYEYMGCMVLEPAMQISAHRRWRAVCLGCNGRFVTDTKQIRRCERLDIEPCTSCRRRATTERASAQVRPIVTFAPVVTAAPKPLECDVCADLPWRRPKRRACVCGQAYAPEHIEPVAIERRSWWQ